MTIVTDTLLVPMLNAAKFGLIVTYLKDFLVAQAGWTVAGSSDGVAGGMDAVDRPSDMLGPAPTTDKWFVLQSPHASAADRIQLLYSGGQASAVGDQGSVSYNPAADYADNGTALPTSSYELLITSGLVVETTSIVDYRYHFVCDTNPPYGFACFGHTSLDTAATKQGAHALIPLDTGYPTLPGKPYVVFGWIAGGSFFDQDLGNLSAATTTNRCVAEPYTPPQIPSNSPAVVLANSSGVLAPNNLLPDSQNRDVSTPILFQHADQFYGLSSWIRWNGTSRFYLDTLSDGVNPRARICLGDANIPWDGSTAPAV